MNINSRPPLRVTTLPAEVKLYLLTALSDAQVKLLKKGSDCPHKLTIIRQNDCELVVLIKEVFADLGAGVYDIIVYDGCYECSRHPIEFLAECGAKDASVEQVQDEKDCPTC